MLITSSGIQDQGQDYQTELCYLFMVLIMMSGRYGQIMLLKLQVLLILLPQILGITQ